MEGLAALRGDYKKDKDSIAFIDFWDLLESDMYDERGLRSLIAPK